jgi:hypothetical protein
MGMTVLKSTYPRGVSVWVHHDSENSIDDRLFGLSTKIQVIAKKAQHTKENLWSTLLYNLSSKLNSVANNNFTKNKF